MATEINGSADLIITYNSVCLLLQSIY